MDWTTLAYYMGILATIAFAATAVLALADRSVDIFGVVVLGVITAVGGGTVRDVILNVPAFWSIDATYIWVAAMASFLAFLPRAFISHQHIQAVLLYLDGFGVALFSIQAAGKVWNLGFGLPLAPVILGVVTAIGGGLIRDVLAGRSTLLMSRELYAIPVLLACTLFVLVLKYFPEYRLWGAILCILLSFGLRAGAIYWNWRVPECLTTHP